MHSSDATPIRSRVTMATSAASAALALVVWLVLLVPGGATAQPVPEDASPEETESAAPDREDSGRNGKMGRREIQRRTEALPQRYQEWLRDVEVLISDEERVAFLEIERDHQRDAFIERFWSIRDPYAENARNEFRKRWYDRLAEARQLFGSGDDDRRRYYLLNGAPTARLPFQCTTAVFPMELWYYRRSERVAYEFTLLFVRKYGRPEYSLWTPSDRLDAVFSRMSGPISGDAPSLQEAFEDIYTCKDGQLVLPTILQVLNRPMEFDMLLARIERPSENPSPEWLATFASYSTDVPEAAATFPAEVSVRFPERVKTRVVVETTIAVPLSELSLSELGASRSYNLALVGEVLRDGKLFETFRYRFDVPLAGDDDPETGAEADADEILPLIFERRLRPGTYRWVMRLEDIPGRRYFRDEREVEVPHLDSPVPDEATREALDAAEAVLSADRVTLQIVPPIAEMQTGYTRFDTLVTGADKIAEVRFSLDDRVRMQKRFAPYSVELDLGSVPRTHRLRVSAHDESGAELASDELVLNQARNAFRVRLIQPAKGARHSDRLRAIAEVDVPDGSFLQKVEFFVGEELLSTVYQEPWEAIVDLPDREELTYVRALATLSDGATAEELVFINAPDYLETVEIQYVELYASVVDQSGRPVEGLAEDDFLVREDGVAQEVRRFEKVDSLPIHMQVMIDTSASMEENLAQTQQAALAFFDTAIKPKDRGALITFNDHPRLAVEATNDPRTLAGGLAGLKAERGTALYDALIFGLYHLNGIKGQRAILLLSDGKDESSRFEFEDTLEYARRAGVAIYPIGLAIKGRDSRQARGQLVRFAEETGGNAFFIDGVGELAGVYAQIERELRSRYLLTYQSSNDGDDQDFRSVEVEVPTLGRGAEVKTIRGYYP
ncbi:MAG: VWA domain-containing protein [Acidobacteria bacterium]|nr:MAG: VWA domain-containing protein [Acidobacteriota bacterium]REK03650.1 MAG: VWA domain-containing protein [Acidobacteriota bacterium]